MSDEDDTVVGLTSRPDEIPNNLPSPLTSFIGREAELAELRRLIGDARLVTITGPPGAGKTRLAVEIARRLLDQYEDGASFVALASITDSGLVIPALALALDVREAADEPLLETVTARLRPRTTLVILDNFEHVTDAAGDIATLLASAPRLRVLVTSRSPLHISGEQEYAVPPLQLPDAGDSADAVASSEAGALFALRAAATVPAFRLDAVNAPHVAELCRRLEGLPLAIELAAARLRLLTAEAIVARLDHRLTLLTRGPVDLPERQRSLRAAIGWSYDILDSPTQAVFRRLSVFRGGWTLDGCEAVTGSGPRRADEAMELLGTLLDASLVYRTASADPQPRYSMLESLRQFGEERLEDDAEIVAVRTGHADYLLALVRRLEPELTGSDQAAALDRIAAEHDNLRAALAHLLETRPADALRLASGLWRFWQMRGHLVEGADWLARGLEAAGSEAPEAVRADALTAAGGLAYWRGDMKETERHYAAALKLRRKLGDDVRIADALYDLAFVFAPHLNPPPEDPTRTARAMSLLDEAEGRYRAANDASGLAKAGWLAGMVMMYRDLEQASSLLGTSVDRFRALNDPFGLGWALRMYGLSLLGTGHVDAAVSAFDEALRLFAAADDGTGIGLLLDDWSELATAQGDALRAARLKGAAASLRNLTDAELAIANDTPWRVQGSVGDALVDPADLETARAEGRAMSQVEATAYALETVPDGSEGGMRVTVLGSFHAERSGVTITNWGGPKAGSRQALAMFAFLMDRAERGVAKDELIEVIWPDADLSQGDLNFHRTMSGLRTVLEPERNAQAHQAVRFANGRYRLSPSVIGWSDVAEFERRLRNAASATDPTEAIRALEAARSLYRGDYLDDCPIYGDSAFVEGHRALLRGRCTDALLDLGRRYEERGELSLAAMRFREALGLSSGDCPEAASGLERLGVASD